MDRKTAYRGQLPYETDFLLGQRYLYEGVGLFIRDILGVSTLITGLACVPGAGLTVSISPGRIYSLANLEPTVWGQLLGVGGLAADTVADHQVVKQGILRDTTVVPGFTAPGTAGQSINYLVQAAFSEADSTPVQRQFYNTAVPTVPILQNVSDSRQDQLVLSVKAGTAATTGSQVTPTPDAGKAPVWVVTIAQGQTTISGGNIVQHPSAPFLGLLAQLVSPVFLGTVNISQAMQLGGVLTPAQITSNQNNYSPAGFTTGATIIRLSTDASRTVTGLAAVADGGVKILQNVGSFDLVLSDADAGSTAANRFSFGANRTLKAGRSVLLIYDGTASRWRDLVAPSKASSADINAGTDDEKFTTSLGLASAMAAQTLTDASTIAWNIANGARAKVTLTASGHTLGVPTGLIEGATGSLQIIQDATGSRTMLFNACWDFASLGTPTVFSTATGKKDIVWYEVIDAAAPVLRCSFQKSA